MTSYLKHLYEVAMQQIEILKRQLEGVENEWDDERKRYQGALNDKDNWRTWYGFAIEQRNEARELARHFKKKYDELHLSIFALNHQIRTIQYLLRNKQRNYLKCLEENEKMMKRIEVLNNMIWRDNK